ncbi:MAG: hypothetical protein NTV06_03010 [candidate division Zixibacteria bacterium]|nr:hypothetical protein [candidate division Zixibacteria bacterium]
MKKVVKIKSTQVSIGMILGDYIYDKMGILLGRSGDTLTKELLSEISEKGIINIPIIIDELPKEKDAGKAALLKAEIIDDDRFDNTVDKVFSIIMHHEEIQHIAAIIKKVNRAKNNDELSLIK